MAIRNRRPRRKAPRRVRRRVAKRRGGKKSGLKITNQYATIVESLASNDVFSDRPYQSIFSLSQFYRATTVAKNFMFYRAKSVKWEYMPLYNTFQQNNSVPAVGKPQFYFMMNRTQDTKLSGYSSVDALFSIQCAGTDPVPFTSNKEIIYKPNWCSPGLTAVSGTDVPPVVSQVVSLGNKKQFGWLPTPNADAWATPQTLLHPAGPTGLSTAGYTMSDIFPGGVVYNGHNIYIQQSNEPDVPVAKVIVTVEWEFKGGKQLYAPPILATDDTVTKDL